MRREEFYELCKLSKPIKVDNDFDIITISFDNGVEVDIDGYDFSFLSKDEKKDLMSFYENKVKEESEVKRLSDEHKKKLKSKFSEDEWRDIEIAFIS